jgi:hypothetical protein
MGIMVDKGLVLQKDGPAYGPATGTEKRQEAKDASEGRRGCRDVGCSSTSSMSTLRRIFCPVHRGLGVAWSRCELFDRGRWGESDLSSVRKKGRSQTLPGIIDNDEEAMQAMY